MNTTNSILGIELLDSYPKMREKNGNPNPQSGPKPLRSKRFSPLFDRMKITQNRI
ncbi:hypothetical protein C943_00120 [Mariniradius saccharolyticus AK6]|uniref:Uncharacterized protein n=1 Tax=Mariniradius saccharolyticus AK6 TaxID=1239962 RepID=M7Y3P2_9BACT|nr:hypothetical protein C943_00120 [Mariniradius saccharolyticus AK6]